MAVWEQANDLDVSRGEASWLRYNELTSKIAKKHGFKARVGAAVFAALSPNNDYYGNVRDVDRLLSGVREGKSASEIRVSTYHPNKEKAWRIATGNDPLEEIVALKTRNFFLNVADPADPEPVTVDGHMHNMWLDARGVSLQTHSLSPKRYHEIAGDIRLAAKYVNIVPCIFQAITWQSWRRINTAMLTDQLQFWHVDEAVAGLGFTPTEDVVRANGNDQVSTARTTVQL